MIDLKKQYKEAKAKAKKLMERGKIHAYLQQLQIIEKLELKLLT